jgi:hypothetical protein
LAYATSRPRAVHVGSHLARQRVQGSRVVLVSIVCVVVYFNARPSQHRPLLPELYLPLVVAVVQGAPQAALPRCASSSRPNRLAPFLAAPSAPPSHRRTRRPRRRRSTTGCSGHAGAACRRTWAPPSPVRPRPATTLARSVKPLAHSSGQVQRPPVGNSGRR